MVIHCDSSSTTRLEAVDDLPSAGRLVAGRHRLPVRVYYEDTDAGGVVYHAGYLRFMERGRTEMLALAGVDLVAAVREGAGQFVVADAALRFPAPARLGDALVVESRVERLRAAAVVVQQSVSRDRQEVAVGRLTIAFVDPDGRPRRLPRAWRAVLTAAMDEAAPDTGADGTGRATGA